MKFLLLIALSAVLGLGCDSTSRDSVPLIPDETPYVVAVLEQSPDTVFHHAQVYVALATDMMDVNYRVLHDAAHKPNAELWHPVAWAQIGLKLDRMSIRPVPYDEAEVSITGPLGATDERTVPFAFETRGVYGDAARALAIRPGARYRLDVRLADGRRYRAETTTSLQTEWALPDTVDVAVSLQVSAPGETNRVELGRALFPWTPPPSGSELTVYGTNATLEEDYHLFHLDPSVGEGFPFEDRNNWVRNGRRYGVFTTAFGAVQRPDLSWVAESRDPLQHTMRLWTRIYSLNTDLGRFYNSEDQYTEVMDGDPWKDADWNLADVVSGRDTTYFRRVSNIRSVDEHGAPLGRDDAVGVFGTFSARYGTVVLRAERDFDPYAYGWRDATP